MDVSAHDSDLLSHATTSSSHSSSQRLIARRLRQWRQRFTRQEISGSLGDLGTLLPLLLAMSRVGAINPQAALFWMGVFNVASAVAWDVPMPVQPMKNIAAVCIADGLSAAEVSAAGIFVGASVWMLGLLLSGGSLPSLGA